MEVDTKADAPGQGKGLGGEDAPWSEKYRPKTLDEVAAHTDIIDTSGFCPLGSRGSSDRYQEILITLVGRGHLTKAVCPLSPAVKKLLEENQLPHLLFYGPPGTGKTSTILALARQIYGKALGNMTLELNASDERGIDIVRNEIQDFASTRTIFRCAAAGGQQMAGGGWGEGGGGGGHAFGPWMICLPTWGCWCQLPYSCHSGTCGGPASAPPPCHSLPPRSNTFKLIILDECDAMTKDAQFALRRSEYRAHLPLQLHLECSSRVERRLTVQNPGPLRDPFTPTHPHTHTCMHARRPPTPNPPRPPMQSWRSTCEMHASASSATM
jgi:hypothetical protein